MRTNLQTLVAAVEENGLARQIRAMVTSAPGSHEETVDSVAMLLCDAFYKLGVELVYTLDDVQMMITEIT